MATNNSTWLTAFSLRVIVRRSFHSFVGCTSSSDVKSSQFFSVSCLAALRTCSLERHEVCNSPAEPPLPTFGHHQSKVGQEGRGYDAGALLRILYYLARNALVVDNNGFQHAKGSSFLSNEHTALSFNKAQHQARQPQLFFVTKVTAYHYHHVFCYFVPSLSFSFPGSGSPSRTALNPENRRHSTCPLLTCSCARVGCGGDSSVVRERRKQQKTRRAISTT